MEVTAPRRLIGILVPPQAQLLDIAGLWDAFAEANRQSGGQAGYDVRLIATSPARQIDAGGLVLLAHDPANEEAAYDTLLAVGGAAYRRLCENPVLRGWLRRHSARARRHGALGTGVFLLGAAGLLDGRNVTTHWQHVAELARLCPAARILTGHVYAEDGPLHTSAGVTAGLDLALRLIEEDHGRELARKVARRLVMALHSTGRQDHRGAHLATQTADEERIQAVRCWVQDHPALDLTLKSLAARAGLGVRHFTRLFRRETGMTPAAYVTLARIEAVKRLLEETSLPLHHVAPRCGFANATIMCRAFLRHTGQRPGDYRARFPHSLRAAPPPAA